MREIPKQAITFIAAFETLRLQAYICPAGFITIGYGHVLSAIPAVKLKEKNPALYDELMGMKINKLDAEDFLVKDLRKAALSILRLIKVPLTDNQYSALLSFVFNCGGGALQVSTLRMKLNRWEYEEVPTEFLRWNKVGGRVMRGLTRRRQEEAKLWRIA